METCEKMTEVAVRWDVRAAYPDVKSVQIVVIEGTSETIFAAGGAMGEAKTGPWVQLGKPRFVAKDKSNGKILGEDSIRGSKCR